MEERRGDGRTQQATPEQQSVAGEAVSSDGPGRAVSGTVTFLFTDIEGSTRLLRTLGRVRYGDVLAEHGRVLRATFSEYGGRVIDTQGDAFFVAFHSAADAISAAATAQRVLYGHEWSEPASVSVRMGLHTGEAALADDRYLGLAVHLAARIGSAAHGGQVLLSDVTRVLVEDELPTGVELHELGDQRLKDIERPVRLHQLDIAGLPAEFPPLRTGEAAFAGREKELAAEAGAALGRRPQPRTIAIAAAFVVAISIAAAVLAVTGGGGGVVIATNSVAVIDPKTNKVVADIRGVGTKPGPIVASTGAIWVASSADQTVTRIDPASRRVVTTKGIGASPRYMAVGRGTLWVTTGIAQTVVPIDVRTNTAGTPIRLRAFAGTLPSADGVDVGDGGVWVYDSRQLAIDRINTGTQVVDHVISPDKGAAAMNQPTPIAVFGTSLWYLCCGVNIGAPSLQRVDLESETSTQIPPGGLPDTPIALARGDGLLWLTLGNELAYVDPFLASPALIGLDAHSRPSAIAFGSGGVWVADAGERKIWRVDIGKKRTTASIPVTRQPNGVAAADGLVWVSVGA